MYPTKQLFHFICCLENIFTETLSTTSLHRDITFDIIESLYKTHLSFVIVGCKQHKYELTKKIVKFYVLTRMHFHLKGTNKFEEQKRKRMKLLKLRRTV